MKWTERYIARAQRKADLRDERFRRHREGVRAGTEPPSLIDRLEAGNTLAMERFETWGALSQAHANELRIHRWPLVTRSYGASLADAWRTWVTDGPVRGPDGVEVTIGVRYEGQDLPFHDPPDDQQCATWAEIADSRKVYVVCVGRMLTGPVQGFCSFATETSARWFAIELAWTVRRAGITGLKPSDVFPERPPRPRSARSERLVAEEIIGVRAGSDQALMRLPQRARARWRQVRTGQRWPARPIPGADVQKPSSGLASAVPGGRRVALCQLAESGPAHAARGLPITACSTVRLCRNELNTLTCGFTAAV